MQLKRITACSISLPLMCVIFSVFRLGPCLIPLLIFENEQEDHEVPGFLARVMAYKEILFKGFLFLGVGCNFVKLIKWNPLGNLIMYGEILGNICVKLIYLGCACKKVEKSFENDELTIEMLILTLLSNSLLHLTAVNCLIPVNPLKANIAIMRVRVNVPKFQTLSSCCS